MKRSPSGAFRTSTIPRYTMSATVARYSEVFPLTRSIRANGIIFSFCISTVLVEKRFDFSLKLTGWYEADAPPAPGMPNANVTVIALTKVTKEELPKFYRRVILVNCIPYCQFG